jgi:hypothetical protein
MARLWASKPSAWTLYAERAQCFRRGEGGELSRVWRKIMRARIPFEGRVFERRVHSRRLAGRRPDPFVIFDMAPVPRDRLSIARFRSGPPRQ